MSNLKTNSIYYVYYYKRKKRGRRMGSGRKDEMKEFCYFVFLLCWPSLKFLLLDKSINNRLYHGCKLLENIIISKQSVFLEIPSLKLENFNIRLIIIKAINANSMFTNMDSHPDQQPLYIMNKFFEWRVVWDTEIMEIIWIFHYFVIAENRKGITEILDYRIYIYNIATPLS